jgi:hypothetical protein
MDLQAIPIWYSHPHWKSEADMSRKANLHGDESVSASELAQMGVCERMVWFEHRYGRRFTPLRRAAAARGQRLHQQFYEQGMRQRSRSRCCIAAHLFGDPSSEVAALRKFRDGVLHSTWYGRALISLYYSASPMACSLLKRSAWLATIARSILAVWLLHGGSRNVARGRS